MYSYTLRVRKTQSLKMSHCRCDSQTLSQQRELFLHDVHVARPEDAVFEDEPLRMCLFVVLVKSGMI